ncbi:hypothetical protein C0J52_21473 [Blattella germanica]|nr:hypothetical protein C0J52_21473 [Blattella germanica]
MKRRPIPVLLMVKVNTDSAMDKNAIPFNLVRKYISNRLDFVKGKCWHWMTYYCYRHRKLEFTSSFLKNENLVSNCYILEELNNIIEEIPEDAARMEEEWEII